MKLIKLGIAKQQSQKGAAMLEKANGQVPLAETCYSQEIRCLKLENEKLKARIPGKFCGRCGKQGCDGGSHCPVIGQQCSNCLKPNHFARACRASVAKPKKNKSRRRNKVGKLSSAEESDSEESFGRVIIEKLGKESMKQKTV